MWTSRTEGAGSTRRAYGGMRRDAAGCGGGTSGFRRDQARFVTSARNGLEAHEYARGEDRAGIGEKHAGIGEKNPSLIGAPRFFDNEPRAARKRRVRPTPVEQHDQTVAEAA